MARYTQPWQYLVVEHCDVPGKPEFGAVGRVPHPLTDSVEEVVEERVLCRRRAQDVDSSAQRENIGSPTSLLCRYLISIV